VVWSDRDFGLITRLVSDQQYSVLVLVLLAVILVLKEISDMINFFVCYLVAWSCITLSYILCFV